MNMDELVQTFKNIVENFNILEGQNRGLKLDYHIFSGATDTLICNLEITILATQEKVSLPCYVCRRMIQNLKFRNLFNC